MCLILANTLDADKTLIHLIESLESRHSISSPSSLIRCCCLVLVVPELLGGEMVEDYQHVSRANAADGSLHL